MPQPKEIEKKVCSSRSFDWMLLLSPALIIGVLALVFWLVSCHKCGVDFDSKLDKVRTELKDKQAELTAIKNKALITASDTTITIKPSKKEQQVTVAVYKVDNESASKVEELQKQLDELGDELLKKEALVGEYVEFLNTQIAMWLSIIAAICTILPVVLAIVQKREQKEMLEAYKIKWDKEVDGMLEENRTKMTKDYIKTQENLKTEVKTHKEETDKTIAAQKEELNRSHRELADFSVKTSLELKKLQNELNNKEAEIGKFEDRIKEVENKSTAQDDTIKSIEEKRNMFDVQSLMANIAIFRDYDSRESTFKSRLPLIKELTNNIISKLEECLNKRGECLTDVEVIQFYQATKQVLNKYKTCFTGRGEIVDIENSQWQTKRVLDNVKRTGKSKNSNKAKEKNPIALLITIYKAFLNDLGTIKG